MFQKLSPRHLHPTPRPFCLYRAEPPTPTCANTDLTGKRAAKPRTVSVWKGRSVWWANNVWSIKTCRNEMNGEQLFTEHLVWRREYADCTRKTQHRVGIVGGQGWTVCFRKIVLVVFLTNVGATWMESGIGHTQRRPCLEATGILIPRKET